MAVEKTIKSEARKNAEEFKKQHAALEGEVKGLKERMNSLENSASRLETAMDQVLQKLDRIDPSAAT